MSDREQRVKNPQRRPHRGVQTRPFKHDPDKLRLRRWAMRMNQTEVAAQAGVTRSHICHLEKGDFGASWPVMRRLAEVLQCSIEDLEPDQPAGQVA